MILGKDVFGDKSLLMMMMMVILLVIVLVGMLTHKTVLNLLNCLGKSWLLIQPIFEFFCRFYYDFHLHIVMRSSTYFIA